MPNLLDKIIIIDIEATCWEGANPTGMESDIIEIGICLLDVQTGGITNNKGILVKPERSAISPFCTELTTITPEMVAKDGISFKEACSLAGARVPRVKISYYILKDRHCCGLFDF